MYDFFTKTLRKKYHIEDERQLYTKFIEHFVQQIDNSRKQNKKKYYKIKLPVNKRRLTEINQILLKRDSCHFYYFYKDRIEFKDKSKWKKAYKTELQNPEIAVDLILVSQSASKKMKIIPYEDTYNVILNLESGFFADPDIQKLKLVKILKEMNLHLGYNISIPIFASAINKQNSNILNDKKERFVIVVAFWKVLCVNANAGNQFHKLPDRIKNIYNL